MNNLLNNTIGLPTAGMRTKVTAAGFRNLEACSRFDRTYVHDACQTVRKTEGAANTKEITMEMELRLVKLCEYAKFQYITAGNMAPNACTMDRCDAVHDWKDQLQDDPEEGSVQVFSEGANKKVWFEAIRGYFAVKKGRSGYPVLYVIRAQAAPAGAAPAWGDPNMSAYLESQGRHNGRLYGADNAVVWLFLRQKCHGTTAWNSIRTFEPRMNGRGAFLALVGQFMGRNVQSPRKGTC